MAFSTGDSTQFGVSLGEVESCPPPWKQKVVTSQSPPSNRADVWPGPAWDSMNLEGLSRRVEVLQNLHCEEGDSSPGLTSVFFLSPASQILFISEAQFSSFSINSSQLSSIFLINYFSV